MTAKILLLSAIFFIAASPLHFVSASADHLLIVEVQIAAEKSSDDFIKIFNPTDSDVYLDAYQDSYVRLVKRSQISSKDYSIKSWSRDKDAKVPAKGFYSWANKDYLVFSGADSRTSQTISENNGVALRLGAENEGSIIDAVGWGGFNNALFEGTSFPENPARKQILQRKQIENGYQDTDNNVQDFDLNPPIQNAQKIDIPPVKEQAATSEEITISQQAKPDEFFEEKPAQINFSENQIQPQQAQLEKPTTIFNVLINEILPSPQGPDEKEEWVELFNQNAFTADISGWKIKDSAGSAVSYLMPAGTLIEAGGFLVLNRPTTRISLNNNGDILSLFNTGDELIDSASYEKAPLGQSFNRAESGWQWSENLTPGKSNVISFATDEKSQFPSQEETTQAGNFNKEGLAAASAYRKNNSKFLFVLLPALGMGALSGIIILLLKKKVKQRLI